MEHTQYFAQAIQMAGMEIADLTQRVSAWNIAGNGRNDTYHQFLNDKVAKSSKRYNVAEKAFLNDNTNPVKHQELIDSSVEFETASNELRRLHTERQKTFDETNRLRKLLTKAQSRRAFLVAELKRINGGSDD